MEKKMKQNVLTIIMLLIVASLLATSPADNIQGKLYFWDTQLEDWVAAGSGFKIVVTIYDESHAELESADVDTGSTGFYSYNFMSTTGAEYVSAYYRSVGEMESFDGSERIDIYYTPEQPEPDPEPNND